MSSSSASSTNSDNNTNSILIVDYNDNDQKDSIMTSSDASVLNNLKNSIIDDIFLSKETNSLSDTNVYDVIIIGAGLAGLSTGYYLKKSHKDLSVLVIEAKDRVGGRTQTVDMKCSQEGVKKKWDLGGQWITDPQTYITALVKEMGIETYKQYDEGINILEANGKTYKYKGDIPSVTIASLLDLQWIMTKMNRTLKNVNVIEPFKNLQSARRLDSLNVRQAFYSSTFTSVARSVMDVAIRSIYGLEAHELNALFVATYNKACGGTIESLTMTSKDCAQEKKVNGGTQQISEKLLKNILDANKNSRILFNRPAIKIDQDSDMVYVQVLNQLTNQVETYTCKKIVTAIPLNQYSSIQFKPELPSYKRNYIASTKIGNFMKFVVTYKDCFWKNKGLSGTAVSDCTVEHSKSNNPVRLRPVGLTYDATTIDGEPAIVGFITGDMAVLWSEQSPELRKKFIIEDLVYFFGKEAANYIDYAEKDWNVEPYAGGCPACCVTSPGVMKDSARALREPFLNMHFCGTETAVQWQGYMDGAIESGVRVANEILYTSYRDNPDIKFDYKKTYYYQDTEIKRQRSKDACESCCAVSSLFKYSLIIGIGVFAAFKLRERYIGN